MSSVSLVQMLHALSDPVRLEIVRRLVREGETSCAALDSGRPKSSMSHHFRVLRESGLVKTRNEGTTHLNSVRLAELEKRFPGVLEAILAAREAGR
jgi:DNA-binding transcriptional ArsR family regulator